MLSLIEISDQEVINDELLNWSTYGGTCLSVLKRFSLYFFKNLSLYLLQADVPSIPVWRHEFVAKKVMQAKKGLGTNSVDLAQKFFLGSLSEGA